MFVEKPTKKWHFFLRFVCLFVKVSLFGEPQLVSCIRTRGMNIFWWKKMPNFIVANTISSGKKSTWTPEKVNKVFRFHLKLKESTNHKHIQNYARTTYNVQCARHANWVTCRMFIHALHSMAQVWWELKEKILSDIFNWMNWIRVMGRPLDHFF